MKLEIGNMDSPIGPLYFACREQTVVFLEMHAARDRASWKTEDNPGLERRFRERIQHRYPEAILREDHGCSNVRAALVAYFSGELEAVEALEVDPGGDGFQAAVWKFLRQIPAGATMTYGEVAAKAGRPGSARAAGAAVGANPIPIVIPCHRVVGKNGSLTGFGGGLPRKEWLLRHEGALLV